MHELMNISSESQRNNQTNTKSFHQTSNYQNKQIISSDIVYEFLLGIGIGMLYRKGWIRPGMWLPLAGIAGALLAIYHWPASPRALTWGLPSAVLVVA